MIWIAIASAALFTGACKKKDDSEKAMDRAASSAQKAQENVNDQAKDVRNEQKDVAKDQADVNKQQRELDSAKTDLIQARDRFHEAAKQRLAKLDDDIKQLEARGDAAAKDTAARLRTQRDMLSTKIDAIGNAAQQDWDAFKKDVDDKFDKAENDARDALKK
jgi:septal ring factor EnvC (AmiA/AmiB activator)